MYCSFPLLHLVHDAISLLLGTGVVRLHALRQRLGMSGSFTGSKPSFLCVSYSVVLKCTELPASCPVYSLT